MKDYEKLGSFYLGKAYDLPKRQLQDDLILYDAKDLTTHAVIIGMTGSGKTGLGIGLLEEALIDNIPVIAIDPKGDLPNLMLNFPQLQADDFMPWVNEQDAVNAGLTRQQYSKKQADLWRKGLADWGQAPERIARLKAAADFTVYTPGSNAGKPVNVLRNFAPPPAAIQQDRDLLRERIQTTTTSLLALLGIDADPIASREHILLSNIFDTSWAQNKSLDLAGLIRAVQDPPFERIGVMDLESFFPAKDRFQMAMRFNNLLAAPGFEAWLEGDPMDVGRFLYTAEGKPRASIFTISHLSDTERMFFVAMLLNEILGWVRTQPGTSSLRAIVYMDEIFGYFPPVKNPPSKVPLLTLLKQARAFGLGVVLSTQNPVDLDYKGLSNTGTWFIGRLQTERDKERVLAGLEGAAAGTGFDRSRMEEILAGLGKRVFLLNNVHENGPVTFQTRWTLSYLRGPLTRDQIKSIAGESPTTHPMQSSASPAAVTTATPAATAPVAATAPPVLPPDISGYYLAGSGAGQGVVYYPGLLGAMDIHYSSSKYSVDLTQSTALISRFEDGPVEMDWDRAVEIEFDPLDLESDPVPGTVFSDLPTAAKRAKAYAKWRKDLLRWVRQQRHLPLYSTKRFKLSSTPGESKADFLARLAQTAREQRDLEVAQLRKKYSSKFSTLAERLRRAEQAIMREQEQAKASKMQTAISFGTAVLGAFLGRKTVSARSAGRFGTAMRSASRMSKETMDIARARETAEAVKAQMVEMEARLSDDIAALDVAFDPSAEELKEVLIKPKSADITLEVFSLVWLPYRRDSVGQLAPDWR